MISRCPRGGAYRWGALITSIIEIEEYMAAIASCSYTFATGISLKLVWSFSYSQAYSNKEKGKLSN